MVSFLKQVPGAQAGKKSPDSPMPERKTGLKQVPTFEYNEVILHRLFYFEIHLIGHSKSKDQKLK